jgi:hypothetical protein
VCVSAVAFRLRAKSPETERALAVRGAVVAPRGHPHPSNGLYFRDLFACDLEDDSVADLDGVVGEPFVEPAQ